MNAGQYKITHGEGGSKTRTKEYMAWLNMLSRCRNPKADRAGNYYHRGLGVCERWESYENFLADMGRAPSADHSIDRLDNDKGYSPENCAWRTLKDQSRNRRVNRYIEHDGKRLCVAGWAEENGISMYTINSRLAQGWDEVRAITQRPAVKSQAYRKRA